jgi:hypothetical protein
MTWETRCRWDDNVKMDLKVTAVEIWTDLTGSDENLWACKWRGRGRGGTS